MKIQIRFTYLFCITFLFSSINSFAVSNNTISDNITTNKIGDGNLSLIQDMNVYEFLSMSSKDIGKKRGFKLNFKERIALGLAKRKLKKALKKGKSESEVKKMLTGEGKFFHLGSFLLGFLLLIFGVAIAYRVARDHVKWAWIGFGIWIIVFLVAISQGFGI